MVVDSTLGIIKVAVAGVGSDGVNEANAEEGVVVGPGAADDCATSGVAAVAEREASGAKGLRLALRGQQSHHESRTRSLSRNLEEFYRLSE